MTNGLPVAPTIYGSKLVSLTAKSVSIGPRLVPNGMLDPGEPDLNTYHGTTTSNLYEMTRRVMTSPAVACEFLTQAEYVKPHFIDCKARWRKARALKPMLHC